MFNFECTIVTKLFCICLKIYIKHNSSRYIISELRVRIRKGHFISTELYSSSQNQLFFKIATRFVRKYIIFAFRIKIKLLSAITLIAVNSLCVVKKLLFL